MSRNCLSARTPKDTPAAGTIAHVIEVGVVSGDRPLSAWRRVFSFIPIMVGLLYLRVFMDRETAGGRLPTLSLKTSRSLRAL